MSRIDATMVELRAIAKGLGLKPYSKKYGSRILLEDAILVLAPFYWRTAQDAYDTEEHEGRYRDYEIDDCGNTTCGNRGRSQNEYLLDVLGTKNRRKSPAKRKRKSPAKRKTKCVTTGPAYSQSYADYALTDDMDTVRVGRGYPDSEYLLRFLRAE